MSGVAGEGWKGTVCVCVWVRDFVYITGLVDFEV